MPKNFASVRSQYAGMEKFLELRKRMDPKGVFLTAYWRHYLNLPDLEDNTVMLAMQAGDMATLPRSKSAAAKKAAAAQAEAAALAQNPEAASEEAASHTGDEATNGEEGMPLSSSSTRKKKKKKSAQSSSPRGDE